MLALFFYDYDESSIVTLLLFLTSFSSAFSDVVFDALIVVQSRKDVLLGSQDLFMVSQFTQGIAGIVGCCIAAFVL